MEMRSFTHATPNITQKAVQRVALPAQLADK
jgi:hypothetical protein